MYCNKFFKTEDEAKAFQKSHGGALYKNVKRSHTRESYRVEAAMADVLAALALSLALSLAGYLL